MVIVLSLTLFAGLSYMKKHNGVLSSNSVGQCPFKSSFGFKARIHNHHYLVPHLIPIFYSDFFTKIITAIAQKLICFDGIGGRTSNASRGGSGFRF